MSAGALLAAAAAAGGIGLALGPELAERLRRPVGAIRDEAPGALVELSDGLTHYRWHGPPEGPVIVAIHGLTTPAFVWEPIARRLAAMGLRVLSYDLWGRGHSDRPQLPHDRTLYLRQLDELLAALGVKEGFGLLGYSMGGSIAVAAAAARPERVAGLMLLASASLGVRETGLQARVRSGGWLGRWLMLGPGLWQLRRGFRSAARAHPAIAPWARRQIAETRVRGYLPAVLSSMRHMLAERMVPEHRTVAEAGIPLLAVWGGQDPVIPSAARSQLAAIHPAAAQRVLDDADHALPLTHPDAVVEAVAAWLAER